MKKSLLKLAATLVLVMTMLPGISGIAEHEQGIPNILDNLPEQASNAVEVYEEEDTIVGGIEEATNEREDNAENTDETEGDESENEEPENDSVEDEENEDEIAMDDSINYKKALKALEARIEALEDIIDWDDEAPKGVRIVGDRDDCCHAHRHYEEDEFMDDAFDGRFGDSRYDYDDYYN